MAGIENAKPTSSPSANPPIIWPPVFPATTKIRKGTKSASLNFQTSFCNATHARNSLFPWQGRMITSPECAVSAFTFASPGSWLAAIGLPFAPAKFLPVCRLVWSIALLQIQSDGGICGWSYVTLTQHPHRDAAQDSPAQRKDRQPLLPTASASLGKLACHFPSTLPQEGWPYAPVTRAFLPQVFPGCLPPQASQNQHAPPWH